MVFLHTVAMVWGPLRHVVFLGDDIRYLEGSRAFLEPSLAPA